MAGTPNFRNRTLFHGDNLPFLRGLNSGTIDLVATDPPFNKGRDFHATPDSLASGAKFQDRWSWSNDVEQAWMDEIEDSAPGVAWTIEAARETYGEDMAAFLCFLGVRLIEMRRVLKPAGSIYVHCDDTAGAYIRSLMDAIFGRENYRNEITWERMQGSKNSARNWGRSSDTILYYVKGEAPPIWNTQYRALSASGRGNYRHDDGDGRGLYRIGDVGAPGNGGYFYDLGLGEVTPKRGYRMPEATARKLLAAGELWIKPGRVPGRKRYLSASKGTAHSNMWYDEDVKGISGPRHPEDTGYPTQKPLALYERIIAASSNPGDVVLDPFCGCATTPIAAERLGRQWIGMDLWDKAHRTVLERLEQEGLAVPDGGRQTGQARMITFGKVRYETEPPERTDGGEVAAPYLQVTERYDIPADGSPRTRAAMLEHLLAQHGPRCQGCDREFDDPRYLQLDHNTPRKDGGLNHISNRVLLCGPCNGLKSNIYTLSGLRRENIKQGYMRGARG